MDLVLDLLATVSRWSRGNLSEISLALVGCLLVLFGSDVKGWAEQRLGSLGGALRVPFMAVMVMMLFAAAVVVTIYMVAAVRVTNYVLMI